MAWLESHQSLRDHPKKDRLAELLFNGSTPIDVADFAASGLLHYLWYWALDYAHDGDLSKFTDRQVAKGCRWNGDATLLLQSLIEAGFVDADRQIHDWDEYAGRLLAKRMSEKERVRNWRDARYADGTRNETRSVQSTNRPTNKPKTRGRGNKFPVPPAPVENYCPNEGATLAPDGHCPVCDYGKVSP